MRSPSTDTLGASLSTATHPVRSGRHPDGTVFVGGLRMTWELEGGLRDRFGHRPAMAAEVVALLGTVPAGLFVDATVGGGGHARAVLEAHPGLRLIGLDRDPDAVAAATVALADHRDRVRVRHARFDRMPEVLAAEGEQAEAGAVSAVLFDLGVSSPQLDRPERGFSYRATGPLDMRMDPTAPGPTAADIVNGAEPQALAAMFAASGEARYARRIAAAIVGARAVGPILDTVELAAIVSDAVPAPARRRGHPARRVFQALRIAVNDELTLLEAGLDAALGLLAPRGVCAVISYHSGEDRLVKERFALAARGGCVCPPGLPCVCGAVPTHRLLTRGARRPSAAEVASNPRAESARLRAVERLRLGGRP